MSRAALTALVLLLCPVACPAAADVVIAVAGSTQGPAAARTAEIMAAAENAAHRVNESGGLAGQQVRVVAEDDGCSGATGDAAARRIVALRPALVLGHPCAAAAVAAAKVYGPARTLFIATATRHPALTARRAGPTVFRLDGRDDRQGAFAADTLLRLHPGERIALVSDRTAYARRIVTSARTALLEARAPEPAMLTLVAGDKDYTRLVAELKASGARAVLFAGFAMEAAIVLRQMRATGSNADFMASDATATREFIDAAGALGAEARFIVRREVDDASGATAASPVVWRTNAALAAWSKAVAVAGLEGAAAILQADKTGAVGFDASGDALVASFKLIAASEIPGADPQR